MLGASCSRHPRNFGVMTPQAVTAVLHLFLSLRVEDKGVSGLRKGASSGVRHGQQPAAALTSTTRGEKVAQMQLRPIGWIVPMCKSLDATAQKIQQSQSETGSMADSPSNKITQKPAKACQWSNFTELSRGSPRFTP